VIPHHDFAIIGGGPGGSLLGWILAKQGRKVVLLDRQKHPRFAVGESSTPIADNALERLGHTYQLPLLCDLARWGTWQEKYPQIPCGKKRGFSYFFHQADRPLADRPEDRLLVTANASDATSDTHWFRPSVDELFAKQATIAGVDYRAEKEVTGIRRAGSSWSIAFRSQRCRTPSPDQAEDHTEEIEADFLIDASGQGRVIPKQLGWTDHTSQLRTATQVTYTHLLGCRRFTDLLRQRRFSVDRFPFDCDDAAQHHLFGKGWLWVLRFNHGITSIGWTRPSDTGQAHPKSVRGAVHDFRLACGANHESILDEMLEQTELAESPGRWIHVPRLQHWHRQVVDDGVALLPTTAATLDPLHSTGLAHALTGVERLSEILLGPRDLQAARLEHYQFQVQQEILLLDELLNTAYAAMESMASFSAAAMLYFGVAIRYEEQRARVSSEGRRLEEAAWGADQELVQRVVREGCQRIREFGREPLSQSKQEIRRLIRVLTEIPLLEDAAEGLYGFTFALK
jgi:FADH2 O2-dependent halogenase